MSRILVTGATGLVGAELVRQLHADGQPVRILRRSSSSLDLLGELAESVEHAVGDVTDYPSVEEAMEGITHVYHAAAYLGFGGKREHQRLYAVNVQGTANVVEAARHARVQRLVHTSSHAAYGRTAQTQQAIDERSVWSASPYNSPYAESKYQAELEIYRGIAEGLDAVIVNPSLIFGHGAKGHVTRTMAERVRDGGVPFVPVGGANVVDVRDVAAGHIAAMKRGVCGERYFLGSENLLWKDIFAMLADAFGVAPPTRMIAPKAALWVSRFAEGVARITRTKPRLTKTSARNASMFYTYVNTKAKEALGVSFRPFTETAQHLAEVLRRS